MSRTAAPLPPAAPLTLALASCQYPAGMLDGSVRVGTDPAQGIGPAHRSLWRLAQAGPGRGRRALIIAGDQVYADATAGLFDPTTVDDALRTAWGRLLFDNPAYHAVAAAWPLAYSLPDDHEIGDNWEPETGREREPNEALLQQGIRAYLRHGRGLSPPSGVGLPWRRGDRLWFANPPEIADHRFFFADTRSERERRSAATLHRARIMRREQAAALGEWIRDAPRDRPSFVVSPAMLLPRRLALREQPLAALHSDAWAGYPASLHALLAAIQASGNSCFVFLSGDEHRACVARLTISALDGRTPPVAVHSVHTAALYAPFPFANAIDEEFAHPDEFDFCGADDAPGAAPTHRCRVETWHPRPGDGFTLLRTGGWPPPAAPQLRVEFHRSGADASDGPDVWSGALAV